MADLFLDLRNREHVLDFVHDAIAFTPPASRKRLEEKWSELELHEKGFRDEDAAKLAKEVGRKSWAGRFALRAHLASQNGCELEWRKAVAAVSDSTAHLLERFRHGTTCESMDAVLNHEESSSAFREMERLEIAEVRRHVWQDIWREKYKEMETEIAKAEKKLAAIVKHLDALRELAADAPWVQDEILSKLERFEDRLYFKGEELNPEILEQEIRYYREEKEIPSHAE